jgi:hypothetical protein
VQEEQHFAARAGRAPSRLLVRPQRLGGKGR